MDVKCRVCDYVFDVKDYTPEVVKRMAKKGGHITWTIEVVCPCCLLTQRKAFAYSPEEEHG